MDQCYVRHALPRLGRRAGIERRVHAHGLRHAFAVDMVRSGAPLYVVRDALGHASVATTQVYLSRVGAHEAVDAMRSREWSRGVRVWLDDARRRASRLGAGVHARAGRRPPARRGGGGAVARPRPGARPRRARTTGYEVLLWLGGVAAGRWVAPLPGIAVHSGNPVGRARMERALEAIRRLHGDGRR